MKKILTILSVLVAAVSAAFYFKEQYEKQEKRNEILVNARRAKADKAALESLENSLTEN